MQQTIRRKQKNAPFDIRTIKVENIWQDLIRKINSNFRNVRMESVSGEKEYGNQAWGKYLKHWNQQENKY